MDLHNSLLRDEFFPISQSFSSKNPPKAGPNAPNAPKKDTPQSDQI